MENLEKLGTHTQKTKQIKSEIIIKSKKNLTLPGRNNPSAQLGLRPAES